MLPRKNFSPTLIAAKPNTESASLPQWYICLRTVTLGINLTDCSACDHCNQRILDAGIDLAKKFLGGISKFGRKFPEKVPKIILLCGLIS